MRFGWISKVYDDNGEVDAGCFIKWALYRGNDRIYTYSTTCDNNPLTGMNLAVGTYKFVGAISTDSGRSGIGSKTFYVANG
jgi:hypothetical protein